MFDYLYKKESLDLYTFLFYDKAIGEFNKDKIKNILYVSYAYIWLNFKDTNIEKVIDYFSHIESIDYLDNLMFNNDKIKKYYIFYPLHNDLLNEETKKRYIEVLKLIKEEISQLNISEYGIYIKAKEDVCNLLEQKLNNKISFEQLNANESVFLKNLEILSKYIDKKDIEAYQKYFNMRNNKEKNISKKELENVFDSNIYDFKELELLKDLKYKTGYSKKVNKNKLDIIKLNKRELNNLRIIILKRFMFNFIFLLLLGLFGYKFYLLLENNIEIEKNIRILLMVVLSMFIFFPVLTVIKDFIKLLFLKKKNKGQVGFINNKKYNNNNIKNNNRYHFSVYLPKDNERFLIDSKYCEKKLKSKDIVMLIKIFNDYYLIKCDESRFL